ncbi:aminotransferase class V-fold PLP-dependent enzyme [Chlamydia trachomatis]|uniref:NifS-related protein n=1 Tax=Chlamydia trachomatis serovar A (strain ATCC VR-571B / DSM 19440 / HAR-13) TaxID=315277 RepID=A0A0H2X2Z5_CHLTA|nr:aminotransferase class V-fold PLP-dependent enzyme [Chlamydia trachomatis]AAX50999.1 NifS-related protein [Chlamydia trachomatis A/HAR-13]
MDGTKIHETRSFSWLNNQQAIPPSEMVKEAFQRYADVFSYSANTSILTLQAEAEASARKLTGCQEKAFTFHFILHYPNVTAIIVAALLENQNAFQGRNHLLVPSCEQQFIINALCRRQNLGTTYDWVTSKNGRVKESDLAEALSPRTLLFSISAANGMTGFLEAIPELAALCKERGVIFHIDLSDILGRCALPTELYQADILTFSSQSLGGIGPSGAMFISPALTKYFSLWLPSNPQVPTCLSSLAAFSLACQERTTAFSSLVLSAISSRAALKQALSAIPQVEFLLEDSAPRLPNVAVFAIPGIPAESLGFFLSQKNIFVGLGYERFQPLSQILQSSGISPFLCHSALHVSFTERTPTTHFSALATALQEGISHLQPLVTQSL